MAFAETHSDKVQCFLWYFENIFQGDCSNKVIYLF